jgi:hypothetical protein
MQATDDYEVDFAKHQASSSRQCGRPNQFLRPRSPVPCRPRSSDRCCRRNSPDCAGAGAPQRGPGAHDWDTALPGHTTSSAHERDSPTYESFKRRPSPSYEPYKRGANDAPHPSQTEASGPKAVHAERGRGGDGGRDTDGDWQWSRGDERDAQREAYLARKEWERQLDERVALLLEEEAREKAQRAAKRQVRQCEGLFGRRLNSLLDSLAWWRLGVGCVSRAWLV